MSISQSINAKITKEQAKLENRISKELIINYLFNSSAFSSISANLDFVEVIIMPCCFEA